MNRFVQESLALALVGLAIACEPLANPTEVGVDPDLGVLPPGAVPFQAQVNQGVLDAISCDQGVCELDISGVGTANIMGRFTWTNHIVEDFTVTPCNTAPSMITMTGATGSIMIVDPDTEGAVCPIPGNQGFGFISSSWEVVGGTGEFSGISGTGTSFGPTAGGGPVVHLSGVVSY